MVCVWHEMNFLVSGVGAAVVETGRRPKKKESPILARGLGWGHILHRSLIA